MAEHKCNKENEIDAMDKKLDKLLLFINGNGEIGAAAKIKILWLDRVSRNRFLEGIFEWGFRLFLVWLIWHKGP